MTLSKKVNYLVAGAVTALLGSAAALAAGPTGIPPASQVFYFGGGSAEPQAVAVATCALMNNVDSYSSAGVGNLDPNYLILYGNLKGNVGTLTAGTPVAIMYKFNGGSLTNGGVPQSAGGQTLAYPTLASVGFAGGSGNYCTPGNGVPTVGTGTFATTNSNVPAFGLTDLEVTAFGGINNPNPGALPVVGAHTGIYDLVFGIAVTPQVFAEKQNFSYAEVAGILSGIYQNWNQLYGDQGAFANQPLPAGDIVLLDRNVGSGHKASSSAEFLGYPQLGTAATLPASVAFGQYQGGADGLGTPPVSCTAEYQDVMESKAAGTVADLKKAGGTAAGDCNQRAIAILSMDNPPGIAANQEVAGTNSYDFVALDGVWVDAHTAGDDENSSASTSYDNVVKGTYRWFYQANFNTRSSGYLTSGSNDALLAAQYLAQFKSATFPGCTGNPGLAFPGNTPGVVRDLDSASSLSACVTTTSRNGNSDTPLFPFKTVPGSITLGRDPL